MNSENFKLDRDRHSELPYMDGGKLHILDSRGTPRDLEVSAMGFVTRDAWELATEVEEVGVTATGDWYLIRESDENGPEVLLFPSRRDLCLYLREWVICEPMALHTLFELGAIKFEFDTDDVDKVEPTEPVAHCQG